MYISKEQIDYIQQVVRIEDVIYYTGHMLIGTGCSKGVNRCPKCNRDNSHIKINSKKNLFKCYSASCGFAGNQFQWIMQNLNIDFTSAVKIVAEIGNIKLEKSDEEKSFEQERQKALRLTVKFYKSYRHEYLSNRGIGLLTQEKFNTGYAKGGVSLKKYLNENKFTNEFLLKIGLLRFVEGKKLMDRFFNSVIIPDIRGNYIYDLYGRSVNPAMKSKHIYLYGQRSLIGWNSIGEGDEAGVVEAPIDAMSYCEMFGKGAFSTGGTMKFDNWHIYQLKRKNISPIFAYDNDESGKLATINSIELCNANNIKSDVMCFTKANDLNEILNLNIKEDIKMISSKNFMYNYQLSKIPRSYIVQYLKGN